jgi:polyisoprenoid-binding protein YceI
VRSTFPFALSLALLAPLASGCCTYVQHAQVGEVVTAANALPITPVKAASDDTLTFVRERSRIAVYGSDVITGAHRIDFVSWDARIVEGPPMRVIVEIDMSSAYTDLPGVDSILKYSVLEVDRFPKAVFAGTVTARERVGERDVEGVAEIHGIRRSIQVRGTVHERGREYRFRTDFRMSRGDFEIRAPGAWDALLADDVRVVVDVVATR